MALYGDLQEYVNRVWLLFTVAVFMLVPFDLLTTLLAVGEHGPVVEANPLMRWLLNQGLFAVMAVHLIVACLVIYLFHVAVRGILSAQPANRERFIRVLNIWIGTMFIAAVGLTANNLIVLS